MFPDACLISGCVSGCLPCAPLCYLASGGSKISKKTRPLASAWESCLRRVKDLKKNTSRGKKHAYIAHVAYILYICYTYSICYAENCVVDRDAAAAGQPPGQPSHPAARGPASSCLMEPWGAALVITWSSRDTRKTWKHEINMNQT